MRRVGTLGEGACCAGRRVGARHEVPRVYEVDHAERTPAHGGQHDVGQYHPPEGEAVVGRPGPCGANEYGVDEVPRNARALASSTGGTRAGTVPGRSRRASATPAHGSTALPPADVALAAVLRCAGVAL